MLDYRGNLYVAPSSSPESFLTGSVLAKFQYTFFDVLGKDNRIPEMPITPFPTLFTAPIYRSANNTVELTVSNFFYEDPTTRAQTALDIYLGNLGPLRHRVYQSSPPGVLTNVSPFVQSLAPVMGAAGPSDPQQSASGSDSIASSPPRYMTSGPLHTIVIVEMPPLGDVMKALEEDALPATGDAQGSSTPRPNEASTSTDARNGASPSSIDGRSLPLLFIRASDGVGYHSGRTVTCENVFQAMDLGNMTGTPANTGTGSIDTNWLSAAQAAVAEEGLHGWSLRVM
jgi:recombining binding protein (suppressor of hairless)